MTSSAVLLASLETVAHETTVMLSALDDLPGYRQTDGKGKRRVYEIRGAQELFEWLAEARLEELRN